MKLAPRRHGPFPIVQVMSPVNYRLELPTQWSIHPVFHIDLLTPYCETPTHRPNYQRPPPELVDGAEEYEVECHGRSVSRLFLKSLSLDMITVAHDRGIVHMIVTRARTSLDRT